MGMLTLPKAEDVPPKALVLLAERGWDQAAADFGV